MDDEDAINGRPGQLTNQRLDLTGGKAEADTESEPELLEEAEVVADGNAVSARGRGVRTTSRSADAATASSKAPSPERKAAVSVRSADRSAAAEAEMRSEQLRSVEKPQLVAPSPAPWHTPQQHAWVQSHYQFLLSMNEQAEERARHLQLRRARAAQRQSRPSESRPSVQSKTATVTGRSGHAGNRLPRRGVTVPATALKRTGARAAPAAVETAFPALDNDDDGFQEAEMVDDTAGEDREDAETQGVSDADIDRRVARASTDDTAASRAERSIDVRRDAPFREATATRPPMSASPPPSPRGRPNTPPFRARRAAAAGAATSTDDLPPGAAIKPLTTALSLLRVGASDALETLIRLERVTVNGCVAREKRRLVNLLRDHISVNGQVVNGDIAGVRQMLKEMLERTMEQQRKREQQRMTRTRRDRAVRTALTPSTRRRYPMPSEGPSPPSTRRMPSGANRVGEQGAAASRARARETARRVQRQREESASFGSDDDPPSSWSEDEQQQQQQEEEEP